MQCTDSFYVVVVVGLRHKEFIRLDAKVTNAGLPVALTYGGHISEGSNAGCHAKAAAQTADLILWQPDGARHFQGGLLPALPVRRVRGVSSAFDALSDWLVSKTTRKETRGEPIAGSGGCRKERAS
jgi:hypothetical protein